MDGVAILPEQLVHLVKRCLEYRHVTVAHPVIDIRDLGLGTRTRTRTPGGIRTTPGCARCRGGPCPPEGDHPHRYVFTLHAVGLDALPVEADTSAAVVGFMLNFNTIEKTALMGLYKR